MKPDDPHVDPQGFGDTPEDIEVQRWGEARPASVAVFDTAGGPFGARRHKRRSLGDAFSQSFSPTQPYWGAPSPPSPADDAVARQLHKSLGGEDFDEGPKDL